MVKSSILKCGKTNNLDGSENDLVYQNNDEFIDEDSFWRRCLSLTQSDFGGFDVYTSNVDWNI